MKARALYLGFLACAAVVSPARAALPVHRPPAELLQEARARMPKLFAQKRATDLPLGTQSTFSACGTWTELSADQSPFHRYHYTMVYDSARDRLLILGGQGGNATQIWTLSLGATPSLGEFDADNSGNLYIPTDQAAAIYDPVRDRVVLLGGYADGSASSGEISVYALSLSGTPTWSNISPDIGSVPSHRRGHTAIYDASRDRMVIFGGYEFGGSTMNDVWAMSFSGTPTWTQLSPSGTAPAARSNHTAVYDAPRDRMVTYGGFDAAGTALGDVRALSLAGSGAWSLISPGGGPPTARGDHAAIVDAPRNRMIVFAGYDDAANGLNDVWSLSFTNPIKWTNVTPATAGPDVPYDLFASVYDPVRQRMLSLLGDEFWSLGPLNGTAAWTLLAPPEQTPLQRQGAVTVYDAPRHRMVMFGGFIRPIFVRSNDLWVYALPSGPWTRLLATGAPPPSRDLASAIYDPVAQRMLVFGGNGDADVLNDTWQLTLSGTPAWTHLTPSGTPPTARAGHSAILDTPRNRMILYGGTDNASAFSDVWSLSLAGGTSWTQLMPTGGAPAREFHTAVFDSPRNRMLTFGWDSNVVWALALTGSPVWSTVSATGAPPPTVVGHVAAYDAVRDRMLVAFDSSSLTATYALTLSGTPAWGAVGSTTPAADGRSGATSSYDTANDQWVMFGGEDDTANERNDVQALSFPSAYPLTVAAAPAQGGSVQESPPGECHPAGSMVTLTAVPAANFIFTGWSGDATGNANPLTITMDAAKNITANFDDYTLTVTVSPSGSGNVARNPALAHYPPNSTVTLTATANTGYGFVNWSGDASGSTNPLDLTMNSSKSVTANFAGYPVNVTINPSGSGTVTKNPNQATYAPGTQVTLTASGSFGFTGWSGDATGNTNPLTITVDGPKNISANFDAFSLTTSVSPAGTGSVTRSPNQTFFNPGSSVVLFGAPAQGYQFTSWSGDLTGTENPDTLVMNSNKSVTANFTLIPPICGGWTLVPTSTKPQPRYAPAAIWDPVRHRMLIHGGGGFAGGFADDWALTLGATPTWTQVLNGSGSLLEATGLYDVIRDRFLVVGGASQGSPFYNSNVYALPLSPLGAWSQIVTNGTAPAGRQGPSVMYDPVRDRILLFGGTIRCGTTCFTPQNDVWELSLSGTPTWTQLSPTGGPPPATSGAIAIYDPVRDRMVVMRGSAGPSGAWALSLSGTPQWTNLNPWGAPHSGATQASYDPIRDRAVLTGFDGSGKISVLDFRDNPNQPLWSQIYPSGIGILARNNHAAVYDPDDDLILSFGGRAAGPTNLDDSYRLDMGGGFLLDAGGTNGTVLPDKWCYSPGEVATMMGAPNQGYSFSQWFGDASGTSNPTQITMNSYKIVRAEFTQNVTDVEEPSTPLVFSLAVRPNPAVASAEIAYSLPRAAEVKLRVFDIAGREVARLVEGVQPGGRHVARWGESRQLRAGIYMVRFDTPAGTWTKRLALLR